MESMNYAIVCVFKVNLLHVHMVNRSLLFLSMILNFLFINFIDLGCKTGLKKMMNKEDDE